MKMKLQNILLDLIAHSREEEWFEFKTNWNEPVQIGEYISALSNAAAMEGQKFAYLVWGIENNTHNVVGTSFDFHEDVVNEPLQHFLARQIQPDVGFEFKEISLSDKRLVVLIIPAATRVPTAFRKTRYLRIGSSKVNLMDYPEHESKLFDILRNGIPTIDNTESVYQDLEFNKLLVYYEAKGITLNKRTFKKNLGLLTSDGKYNILAQLLSDNSHIPIRFSLFMGSDKASKLYSVREFGNTCLLYSLDDVLSYGDILNVPQADERNRVVERKEVLLFNKDAWRESVINAFVHNRWIDGNAPMFSGFKDRIQILSHGSLPPGQTIEGFFAGESLPVNKALSDIFLQLHISERSGRGIPKIVGVYGRKYIKINENSIDVTLPFHLLKNDISSEETFDNDERREELSDDAQDSTKNVQDKIINAQDSTKNAQDNMENVQDKKEIVQDKLIYHTQKLLKFCAEPRSMQEIVEFLGYKDRRSVRKILDPLIEQGRIARTVPEKITSRNQKYVAIQ